ncbi:MAG TPA: GNAT family N-acetyltransferase [Chitinophagales bacterium]|nr:GNAT family N-acetyltransferase [Chitinophagales bacterium]HRK28928.1 GNAT family N-acetyltransferase [Chitinophagales bacterium]
MSHHCTIVTYGSEAYNQTVALRTQILRKPLNLHFTPQQLAEEVNQVHFATFSHAQTTEPQILACLILVPNEQTKQVKMRQVAVADHIQKQGVGAQLVRFAENWAVQQGYTLMYCHARDTAVPFYLKLGYAVVGEGFTEVGIPHYYMERRLLR